MAAAAAAGIVLVFVALDLVAAVRMGKDAPVAILVIKKASHLLVAIRVRGHVLELEKKRISMPFKTKMRSKGVLFVPRS